MEKTTYKLSTYYEITKQLLVEEAMKHLQEEVFYNWTKTPRFQVKNHPQIKSDCILVMKYDCESELDKDYAHKAFGLAEAFINGWVKAKRAC